MQQNLILRSGEACDWSVSIVAGVVIGWMGESVSCDFDLGARSEVNLILD